jgi:hypothetical protein
MSTQRKAPSKKSRNYKRSSEEPLVGTTGRWTQWIKPRGAALLSKTLRPVLFVIKNHGPDNLFLVAGNGDLMDLSPGAVRATYASGTLRVENRGREPAFIEFEFQPIARR